MTNVILVVLPYDSVVGSSLPLTYNGHWYELKLNTDEIVPMLKTSEPGIYNGDEVLIAKVEDQESANYIMGHLPKNVGGLVINNSGKF